MFDLQVNPSNVHNDCVIIEYILNETDEGWCNIM